MRAPASPPNSPNPPRLGLLAAAARNDRRLFASLHEGVWERDLKTDEAWYSPRFKELLGFTEEELPNKLEAIRDLLHPDDLITLRELYAKATEQLASAEGQVRMRTKEGVWRWFRGRVRVWPDADGRPDVLVGALWDVHEQVLATEALTSQQAVLEQKVRERTQGLEAALRLADAQRLTAERASLAKASFLAQMGHELRTPLNGMLGMTQLAMPLATSDDQRRYLDLAHKSGLSLLRILDDVLEFTRADAGRVQLQHIPFDLAELAAETVRGFMPNARTKGLQMGFDYVGNITQVRGDPGRVRQLFSNLLGNAVKFTEHGYILLVVEIEAGDAGQCVVRVKVRDSGIGMDEATVQRVFEPFEQADSGITRRHGGTGLGLSVVRLLAGMMGGEVAVRSRPGHGSSFWVDLRLAAAEPEPQHALAVEPLAAQRVSGHAWLIGRTSSSGKHIQMRLARTGWSCELLDDTRAAIAALTAGGPERAPACVVIGEAEFTPPVELNLLCSLLPPEVPVTLLLRPDFDLQSVRAATEHAQVRVVISPMTPADLHALVRPTTASELSAAADPGWVWQPSSGDDGTADRPNVLVVEDNTMNQIIVREMIAALGIGAAVVGSGEEAMNFCRDAAPDLVLMDIQMPGMDGLETTRRLRALQAEGQLPRFPIIALTAHALAADAAASLKAGMDEHMTKPIQIDLLRRVLQRWLTPV